MDHTATDRSTIILWLLIILFGGECKYLFLYNEKLCLVQKEKKLVTLGIICSFYLVRLRLRMVQIDLYLIMKRYEE